MALTTVPASLSATALTLTTAAQPNITSVGTLTGLTVSGNIAGTLTTAAQTNITSVGTLTGLTVSGTITSGVNTITNQGASGNLIVFNNSSQEVGSIETQGNEICLMSGNGGIRVRAGASSVIPVNVSRTNLDATTDLGSSAARFKDLYLSGNIAGTLTTAAQTNITSLGTLSALTISGDLTVDTSTLKVDSTNNRVGIGTATPSVKLHVRGSAVSGATFNGDDGLTIEQSGGGGSNINLIASTNTGVLFSDAAARAVGLLNYSHSDNSMRFNTNGSEAMRIDSSGNVGIGRTPTAVESAYDSIQLGAGGIFLSGSSNLAAGNFGQNYYVDTSGNTKYLGNDEAERITMNNGYISFESAPTNSSGAGAALTFVENMRIDSNGLVGIGADTPSGYFSGGNNLVVKQASGEGGITIVTANNTTGYLLFADGTSGDARYRGQIAYTHSTDDTMYVVSTGKLSLRSGSSRTERMLIDSSGNVSMNAPANLDVGGTASGIALMAAQNQIRVGGNDGTNMYTGYQLMLDRMNTPGDGPNVVLSRNGYFKAAIGGIQGASGNATSAEGNLAFYTATTSAFNERMRILAGGDVGVGTSSVFGAYSNRRCFSINGTSSTSLNIGVGGAQKGYLYSDGAMTQLGSMGAIPLKFAPNDTERARIDSNGNFGIGATSVGARLEVRDNSSNNYSTSIRLSQGYNSVYSQISSNFGGDLTLDAGEGAGSVAKINFKVDGDLKGLFKYDGDLMVGSYAYNSVSGLREIGSQGRIFADFSGNSAGFEVLLFNNRTASGTCSLIQYRTNTTVEGSLIGNGSGISISNNSDYRKKKNIRDLTGSLNIIKQLQPRLYEYKEEFGKPEGDYVGFIAHEIQEHIPSMVNEEKDAVYTQEDIDAGTTNHSVGDPKYQTVAYSNNEMITRLVQAMQEQQVIIEALQAEVAVLKGE